MGEISITIKTKYNIGDIVVFRLRYTNDKLEYTRDYYYGIIKEILYNKDNQNTEYIINFGSIDKEKVTELDILTSIDPKSIIQLMKTNQLLVEESLVIQKIRNKIKEHLDALEANKDSKSGIISKAEINFGEMICRQCLSFIDEVEKEI